MNKLWAEAHSSLKREKMSTISVTHGRVVLVMHCPQAECLAKEAISTFRPHPTCHVAPSQMLQNQNVQVGICLLNFSFYHYSRQQALPMTKTLRFPSTIKFDFPVCRRVKVEVTVITAVFLLKAECFTVEFGPTSNQHSVLESLGLFWSGQTARKCLWTEKVSKVHSNFTKQTRWNTKISQLKHKALIQFYSILSTVTALAISYSKTTETTDLYFGCVLLRRIQTVPQRNHCQHVA